MWSVVQVHKRKSDLLRKVIVICRDRASEGNEADFMTEVRWLTC